jgi:hypothetical protein
MVDAVESGVILCFIYLSIVVLPFKRHFRTSLEEMNFSHEDSVPDPQTIPLES